MVIIGSNDDKVYALNYDGSLLWSFNTGENVHRGISLADVDGDGKLEILVPNNLFL